MIFMFYSLLSVGTPDLDRDLNFHQKLMDCFLDHAPPLQKIRQNSFISFMSNLAAD